MRYVVYKLTNKITQKAYIGKTNDLKARLRKHKSDKNCIYLNRAIRKYGLDNFTVDVLEEFDDEQVAYLAEAKAIVGFKTLAPYGYNLLPSDGIERKLSKTSLKKLSKTLQGRTDLAKETSKFLGVRKRKGLNVVEMRIRFRGERYQKYYPSEIEAAEAYDKLALYLYGLEAKINFVDNIESYMNGDLKAFFLSVKRT